VQGAATSRSNQLIAFLHPEEIRREENPLAGTGQQGRQKNYISSSLLLANYINGQHFIGEIHR
jgi:hypothetical protein